MDDLILPGNDIAEINLVKNQLDSSFRIKDLGTLCFFLGLEVVHSLGISMCKRQYGSNLLIETGFKC